MIALDTELVRERDRCLQGIRTRVGSSRIEHYAAVLNDFIQWSLGIPELVHEPHHVGETAQDTFKFVARENGQVIWEVFPRDDDGAKLIALPKVTAIYPEVVRAEVRKRWGEIDNGKENSGNGEARLSFLLLFREQSRQQAQNALAWAVSTRNNRSNTGS